MKRVAIVVFVKTPGISPVKTRLAADIGEDRALAFYQKSCIAVQSVVNRCLQKHPDFSAMWAVAESGEVATKYWSQWPCLYQGSGELGERLHRVYSILIKEFEGVILLGGDCPQFSVTHLEETIGYLESGHSVIGPAFDGGYYLFASSESIPRECWISPSYSSPTTRKEFLVALELESIRCEHLAELRDVDTVDDLVSLRSYWAKHPPDLDLQQALQTWL